MNEDMKICQETPVEAPAGDLISHMPEFEVERRKSLFTDSVNDAVSFLGLRSFQFHVLPQIKHNARGSNLYHTLEDHPDSSARVFSICYSVGWLFDKNVDDLEIKTTAWHEVFEAMFYRLRDFSTNTKYAVSDREVDDQIHTIVRTFENTMLPLILEKIGSSKGTAIRESENQGN